MKRVAWIAAVGIVLVGLTAALAAWWQSSRAEAELAALRDANAREVARLLQKIASQEGSLRDQELDYTAKLRKLAEKDGELDAFLKNLLAKKAANDVEPRTASRSAPVPPADLEPEGAEEAPVEREAIEYEPREYLSRDDDHNADGVIDGKDVAIVHALAGRVSQRGDEDFDPAADMDGDGVISVNDSVALWELLQQHGQPGSK
jgi:hypothetical protein